MSSSAKYGHKRRTFTGSIHPPPNVEVTTHTTASFDSRTGEISMKRVRLEIPAEPLPPSPAGVSPTSMEPVLDAELDPPNAQKATKRKQGASIFMQDFLAHHAQFQAAILAAEYDETATKSCQLCKRGTMAEYRCEEGCSGLVVCQACVVSLHQHLPFHHIQQWTGQFFRRTSLSQLGAILSLGHRGDPCPNNSRTSDRRMVIVHTNGVHQCNVQFCSCAEVISQDIAQLLRHKLFPATTKRPETAFTFSMLKDFQTHHLASKVSAYDYHKALMKLSNSVDPQSQPQRYYEFLRVARYWRHLAVERRSGQFHGIDDILDHRHPGSLAVHCPACPQIGFNVPKEVVDSASEEETHKFTAFISTDGNRKQIQLHNVNDPDDVALNQGRAYFADDPPYQEYVAVVKPLKEDSQCTKLRAVTMQHMTSFKNAAVSGIVAVQCARHGFFLARGVVDLYKGEAFANTDYALANALLDFLLQRWIMLSYDIWCQYVIHLAERFWLLFPRVSYLTERIRGAIPKLHVRNHKIACQDQWSFNYIKYSGETCGENIEGTWAEQNQSAGSAKRMNAGHRHDTLDEIWGGWNWEKFISIVPTLVRMYTDSVETYQTRQKNFKKLTKRHPEELTERWSQMEETPVLVNGEYVGVYNCRIKGAAPTQAKAYETLIQQEITSELAGQGSSGDAQLLQLAFKLQSDMETILAMAHDTPAERKTLNSARLKLRHELKKYRATQLQRWPQLRNRLEDAFCVDPEKELLFLPSDLSEMDWSSFGLETLAVKERSMREGQAYDALEALRNSIKAFNVSIAFKKWNVSGQGLLTRAQAFLETLHSEKNTCAHVYRRARAALLQLGMSPTDRTFLPLKDTELWGKNMALPAEVGHSKTVDPWFWTVGCPPGVPVETWSIEMDRVKWFRDRAARDRAREEIEILEEEFRRVHVSFETMSTTWTRLAERTSAPLGGQASYAYKQAAMYEKLRSDCMNECRNLGFEGNHLRYPDTSGDWMND